MAPSQAFRVSAPDGAQIACFEYVPECVSTGDSNNSNGRTPVLFLHGNGEEHGIFGPQIDAVVAAGHAAIGVDSRAQGQSTRGTARLTYEFMAQDALLALDVLEVQKAHVVGFSDGAIEALLLARDVPERVASIVAIGANLEPEGVDNSYFPMDHIASQNSAWASWIHGLPSQAAVPGGKNAPCVVDPSLLMPGEQECRNTTDLMRLMMEEPHINPASLATISCPTCIMCGEFDVIFPHETTRIARSIPNARLVIAPDCGHSLPKQAPDLVSREVLRTIGQAHGPGLST